MSNLTREETIEEIKRWTPILLNSGQCTEKTSEAQDMAISALSENKRDLISRGEVGSVLHNNLHALIDTDQLYQLYKDINRLPAYSFPDSAENKGEWIDNGNGSYTCSNCKTEWTTSQIEKMYFCPTCGADMRGRVNEHSRFR